MNVLIRADAGVELGSGHVMRCLTLADRLRELGARVVFASRRGYGDCLDEIAQRGFDARVLDPGTFEAGALRAPAEKEARDLSAMLDDFAPVRVLIVDHYALGERYERIARARNVRVAAIDDMADRRHDCDLLLDQNVSALEPGRYDALVPSKAKRLLGPRFALLRAEFEASAAAPRARDGRIDRVLVFMGGFDSTGQTEIALEALDASALRESPVDVVLRDDAPCAGRVRRICASKPKAVFCGSTRNMAQLMERADLAVGAGGVATWERALLGLPSVLVAVAENQLPAARRCAELGAVRFAGDANEVSPLSLAAILDDLAAQPQTVREMSAAARAMMGNGGFKGARAVAAAVVEIASA